MRILVLPCRSLVPAYAGTAAFGRRRAWWPPSPAGGLSSLHCVGQGRRLRRPDGGQILPTRSLRSLISPEQSARRPDCPLLTLFVPGGEKRQVSDEGGGLLVVDASGNVQVNPQKGYTQHLRYTHYMHYT